MRMANTKTNSQPENTENKQWIMRTAGELIPRENNRTVKNL